jgi:hypothetical protein
LDKQAYINQAADWARVHGFVDIRANTEGFDQPIAYGRQQDGQSFMPDVTGKQFGHTSYFEVITQTDEAAHFLSKLKLISQLATAQGGQLYLMVPKNQLAFTKKIMANNQIRAEIVQLR